MSSLASPAGPSYGTAGAASETLQVKTPAPWEWRGNSWWLMFEVVKLFGRQFLMLMALVTAVFTSKEYLMNCNPELSSIMMATACEYTKAHVRCFPLLALVVSLFAACRMYLYLRILYQMLKRNVLIELEVFEPYKDPLFMILVFCMSQAILHFVLNLSTLWGIQLSLKSAKGNAQIAKAEDFQESVYQLSVFYVVPTALFFGLFYASYDISELVLPFSKYFEGNSENAQEDAKHLQVISEVTAMRTVQVDLLENVGPTSADKMYEIFIEAALAAEKDAGNDKGLGISIWRLSAAWWPAKLLLDYRIGDSESLQFKNAWYVFNVAIIGVTAFVVYFCALVVEGKVVDVAAGQYEDIAGLIVGITITAMIIKLGYEFSVKTVVLPISGFDFRRKRPTATVF